MSNHHACALLSGLLAVLVACGEGQSTRPDAGDTPLPDAGDASQPDDHSGRLRPLDIPAHPFLAATGRNGMHSDAWATDTHEHPGPLGVNAKVTVRRMSMGLGGLCATQVFDGEGHLFSVCTDLFTMRLVAMDPATLEVLASHTLPQRASSLGLDIMKIQSDTSGGAYFHLLAGDRPLIANAERHLQIFRFEGDHFVVEADWDLNPHLPTEAHIVDALPDWSGLYWIITREGHIATFDPQRGRVRVLSLEGEEVQNSVAVAEDGVYLVSNFALYRLEADADGVPSFSYRIPYDRGSAKKPGAINQGSGTTPTLLPDGLVAISDNADEQVHVLVYHRLPEHEGERLICETPVFEPGKGFTENSLIGYERSLIIENNYGYEGPLSDGWTSPGISRVDVRDDFSGCDLVWTNPLEGMTPVAKLSTETGLVYTYTRERTDVPEAEVWNFTGIDYFTGETAFHVRVGDSREVRNNYGPISLDAAGTAFVGVLGGIVSIADQ